MQASTHNTHKVLLMTKLFPRCWGKGYWGHHSERVGGQLGRRRQGGRLRQPAQVGLSRNMMLPLCLDEDREEQKAIFYNRPVLNVW